MNTKQKGLCPFCDANVAADVLEARTLRRDRCRCPNCEETLYVCRSPGCHNYTKGTASWDHELCPECRSGLKGLMEVIGSALLGAGLKLGGDLAKDHIKGKWANDKKSAGKNKTKAKKARADKGKSRNP